MDESVWYRTIENKVNSQIKFLNKRDFKFYHVDSFVKICKRVDGFSSTCSNCNNLKANADFISENLKDLLNGTLVSRRIYEKKLDKMSVHLRKIHRIYPNRYFTSLFSFAGMAFGMALGVLLMYLFNPKFMKEGFAIGAIVTLFFGRQVGKYIDKKVTRKGKNLN